MSSRTIILAYLHHLPLSDACSIRCASIAAGVQIKAEATGAATIKVIAALGAASPQAHYQFERVEIGTPNNRNSLAARILGELRFGFALAGRIISYRRVLAGLLVSSPPYLSAIIASATARVVRAPFIVEVRDLYPEAYCASHLLNKQNWIYRILLALSRDMYARARLVVALTEGIRHRIQHLAPQTNVSVVYNGFPKALLTVDRPKAQRFTLCFHGNLGFFQDIDTLVKVANQVDVDEIDVVVIGSGRKEPQLKANAEKNLHYFPARPFEETIELIATAHVGLCLRLGDDLSAGAMPVKVFEYIGLGIPALVSPRCEAGDLLERIGCGWQFDAGDVPAIVAAVRRLKSDYNLWERMSSAARAAAPGMTRELYAEQFSENVFEVLMT